MTRGWRFVLGVAFAMTCFGSARAEASALLFTHGSSFVEYGSVEPQQDRDGNTYTKAAFKESYFGVFWINLWTWGGEWCCENDDQYIPETKAEMAELLHKPEADLKPPFFYRFPLGWFVLGALLVGVGFTAIFGKNEPKRLAAATVPRNADGTSTAGFAAGPAPLPTSSADVRAVEIYRQALANGEATQARADAAFEAGVAHLVENGASRDEAIERLLQQIQAVSGGV